MPTGVQFNKLKHKPLVLIAPLDWGLGHTTRCIPIISHLLSLNCSVIIACNKSQQQIFEEQFPHADFMELAGYNIRYGSSGLTTYLKMIGQIPAIFKAIKAEHAWLKQCLTRQKPDLILSDNRYGFYSSAIPSVFITHQLLIRTGGGKSIDRLLQKLNYRFINRFVACWVPDIEYSSNCGGILSHPPTLPSKKVRYIGCVSRFKKCSAPLADPFILVILSGPEPQRSIFEQLVLSGASDRSEQFIIIRGLQNGIPLTVIPDNIKLIDFAHATELNNLICNAEFVIARSGYTTIMDLLSLRKRSVLVPTPGQPEQLYLAKHMIRNNFAWTISQETFTIQKAIDASKQFQYKIPDIDTEKYKEVINEFVGAIT